MKGSLAVGGLLDLSEVLRLVVRGSLDRAPEGMSLSRGVRVRSVTPRELGIVAHCVFGEGARSIFSDTGGVLFGFGSLPSMGSFGPQSTGPFGGCIHLPRGSDHRAAASASGL